MSSILQSDLKDEQLFALLHIPHSSTFVPDDIRTTLSISDADLASELLRVTDHYTDELFQFEFCLVEPIIFGQSRLVVDVERFRDDQSDPMSRCGWVRFILVAPMENRCARI